MTVNRLRYTEISKQENKRHLSLLSEIKLLTFCGPSREFSLQGKLLPDLRRVGHVQRVTTKICLLVAEAFRAISKYKHFNSKSDKFLRLM